MRQYTRKSLNPKRLLDEELLKKVKRCMNATDPPFSGRVNLFCALLTVHLYSYSLCVFPGSESDDLVTLPCLVG